MTKVKVKRKKASSAGDLDAGTDAFLDSMLSAANSDGLMDIKRGEIFGNDVGIPMPALAPRYLFQRRCLPLSRILVFSGEEGSCKSALLYELMRWILTYKGCVFFAENELKDAPLLRGSIMGWDESMLRKIVKCETTNMEEWQTFLIKNMRAARKAQTTKGGLGKRLPLLFCLDSLMSTDRKGAIEDVETVGHTSLGYAVLAQLATKYSRTLPKQLQNFPFLFVATNHLKPGIDAMGNPKGVTPGGKSMKFHESAELEMKKLRDIVLEDQHGISVAMKAAKNCFGESRKDIMVNLLWRTDPSTGRQFTEWDWHTSSIQLLVDQGTKFKYMRDRIKAASGIEGAPNKTAFSPMLGVPKTDPIPYADMSRLLEANLDVLDELYKVLGILPCKAFEIGKDYDALQLEAETATREKTQTLYQNAKLIPQLAGVINSGDDTETESPEAEEASTDA